MKLKNLLKNINYQVVGNIDTDIKSLSCDTRAVEKEALFFCLEGSVTDGHKFADRAVELGAVALVTNKRLHNLSNKVTQIIVENVRQVMSLVSKTFFGSHCDELQIISIVGTNGKTSISYILQAMFTQHSVKCAVIGTNGTQIGDLKIESQLTTPDPIELHYLFKQIYNLGVKVVIIEVSAHAIFLEKMHGIRSDIGIFTNITDEHLDYFKSYENYKQTKFNFFNSKYINKAIINIDDKESINLLTTIDVPYVCYGIANPADTFAINISTNIKGSRFVVNASDKIFEVESSLVGIYNVYNILAGISVAFMYDISMDSIITALKNLKQIDGRFKVINLDCNNKIIIDYAHTPDGFEQILSLIRKLRGGHIITIFGCVGYSTFSKRQEMGKIASKYSDEIIITTDNPNFTPFEEICDNILSGISSDYSVTKIFDRDKAIEYGFAKLFENSTLVILGKGAEKNNLINGKNVPHNDEDCVNRLIEKNYNVVKIN